MSRKLSEWVPVSELFVSGNNITFCNYYYYYFVDDNYDDNDDNNNQNYDYDNATWSEQNSSRFEQ